MFSFLLWAVLISSKLASCYVIILTSDGDVIRGGTAQFKTEVLEENGVLSPSEYIFEWEDNVTPIHSGSFKAKSPAFWNITYDLTYRPSIVQVTVKVKKEWTIFQPVVGTSTTYFAITEFLEGDLVLTQGNLTRKKYISNELAVHHSISLKESNLEYLNKTKNYIRTFWFVDCVYYGIQNSYDFYFNYTKVDSVHHIEALLVASNILQSSGVYHSLPSDVETIHNNATSGTENGTIINTSSNSTNISSTNATNSYEGISDKLKEWLLNFNKTDSYDSLKSKGYCLNSSVIPLATNYTYGFFKTSVTVKAPVKISPMNGTNWLKDGDILNLRFSCNGSSPYGYCYLLKSGLYNVTGNETCNEEKVGNCSFEIQRLFKKPSEYTIVVVISNSVSRVVKPIAVNIYKVKKHAQLSVIIVPVTFSLIATILIIFGVAYYVQSRHKYTIEVADFDFGNQTSSMEYKTFRERLRESIVNSFLKSNDFEESESSWSESAPTSKKYGSMQ